MADKPHFKINPSDATAKMKTSPDLAPSLSKFVYKALIVVAVIVVVPLFPSRAPEFINRTLFARGWELVHLLFVGIAVCYGLFGRRNDEGAEKETGSSSSSKFENAQTYVSRFLQVPSVFDDEVETLAGDDESRVQSWSSQYSRGEPVVVVAADESREMVSRSIRTKAGDARDKPLLLPVRSLKSRVLDSGVVEHGEGLFRRSNSGSDRNSSRRRNEGGDSNVVLRSPIPWRSRSGRMEMREEAEGFDHPKLSDEYAFKPVRSDHQRTTLARSDSTCSTPKSLSPSPSIDLLSPRPSGYTHSVSPELQAKDVEDESRRKSFYKSPPPPAPPLPPPTYHKSSLMYSGSGGGGSRMRMASEKDFTRMASDKDLRRSRTSEGKDSSKSVREEMARRSGPNSDNVQMVGKSVRTARSGSDSLAGLKGLKDVQEAGNESKWKDVMEAPKERVGRKLPASIPAVPVGRMSDPEKEEKEVPEDIVAVESDCESESEDEVRESLSSCRREESPQPVNNARPDFGPDVDKKADEFIAKFREQIRLQRIESIKRSTYQVARKVT